MRLVHARGVESEAEVPFAGLAELLRPALAGIDRIPARQAQALAGALALGPASTVDRFAIGAATLSLLSAFADDGPVALVIDDAQLLDRSSAEALLFALRRLIDDPIAVVLAVREGEPSLLDGADLRIVRVGGLTRGEAGALLTGVAPDAVDRVFRATGGNPLALLELAAGAEQLAAAPVDAPLPLSASIAAAFGRRLDRLPGRTQRALLLAAAGDSRDLAVLARAAAVAGVDLADLTPAEEAGLVSLAGGGVEFTHPLVRSAAYAEASAAARREAHAALAAAVPERDIDRRAWHLAAAAVGPDAAVSAALEQAGRNAERRSAYAVAAGAYERAARLAVSEDARGRLLCAAADAAWLGGDSASTASLLDEARAQTADPRVLARIDHLRGHLMLRRGPVYDGYRLLAEAAEGVAEIDPELAVVMLAESVLGAFYAGHTAAMAAAAGRAATIVAAADSPRALFFAEMAAAMARVAQGAGDEGAAHARRAVALLQDSDELRDDPRMLAWATLGPMYLREADLGRELIERASDRARAQGAAGTLPAILQNLARDQATTDRWWAAEANLDEAIRLATEMGQRSELAAALAGLAWLQARQGREEECRRNADEADRLCGELGMGTYGVWAIQALGDLELGLGRPAAAIAHHEAQAEALRDRGIADVDLSPAPELVDSYLRLGRADEAATVAAAYVAGAEAKGQPWALARAARCRGMLAPDGWRRCVRRGARPACAHPRRLRGGAHAPGVWRAPAPRGAARPQPRRAARGARGVRAPRLAAVGRAGPGRARGDGRDGAPPRPEHPRRPHSTGVSDRTSARERPDDARGRRGRVPEPEDDRVPPAQHLPQARHPHARGARRDDGAATGLTGVAGAVRTGERPPLVSQPSRRADATRLTPGMSRPAGVS